MKIFTAEQIREWDQYTIHHESVDSLLLMERAAARCTEWLLKNCNNANQFMIFCGKGNNGGDGLAIARILFLQNRVIEVFVVESYTKASSDFSANFQRLQKLNVAVKAIWNREDIPVIPPNAVIVDALYGSGLNRPPEGITAELINTINLSGCTTVAVDIPSGLFTDKSSKECDVVQADFTLSFQSYKLAFLLPENEKYTGEAIILDIGLHAEYVKQTNARFELTEQPMIRSLLLPRKKFAHKGSFGHAALLTGSYGMMGAATLAAEACLRSGAGKVSVHIPACGVDVLQVAVPEAICEAGKAASHLSKLPNLDTYDAVGIGPGIGMHKETIDLLEQFLLSYKKPVVADADALNIIAKQKEWLTNIPPSSVLTPHHKEFERLFGLSENDFERIELAMQKAKQHNIYIILKGRYSFIASPDGKGYFNSTGNTGMATAGSGDVLTGMITGLLAQGYNPLHAALIAVYWHGLAGDLAAKEKSEPAMIAGDIVAMMGRGYIKLSE
ncbi:MAG: NAD(P)H-hydrate dehydratase [Chitinophagaceae bacterium]|nr:NAD(P)H-hydrate dehydratase [Chitinophagaceae bacterium]